MRPSWKLVKEAEEEYIKKERIDYSENLRIFEEMWKQAVKLGILPPENPLENIEAKIRLAKYLNYVRRSNSKDRSLP